MAAEASPAKSTRRIGAHVPVAGGLVRRGVAEGVKAGAETVQIFVGSPRGWTPPRVDERVADDFRAQCSVHGWPVFVHAAYLINLASPDTVTLERSVETLRTTMTAASLLGAQGVVVHAGSSVDGDRTGALRRVAKAFRDVLEDAPPVRILVEPTAGAANAMASTLASTVEYMQAVGLDELGLCLDTCHLHAAGEVLADPAVFEASLRSLAADLGPGRVDLVHFNDSKAPWGSRRDRHESLGVGTLGEDALRSVVSSPALAGIPLIVETASAADDVAYAKWLDRPGTVE
ncbi:deoxyribonuclease IV [Phytomonospora sp. NPDC050363]|uniref:deoxyribonuclease IV n=1 Tax=Phytomonospora sp. NPDC050363 TaxID=3155642 RepID=UPI0033F777D9